MTKVFIDGSAGTTGLRIRERLAERRDLELVIPDEAKRKDTEYRREALNSADVVFLCLPDDAAREAVSMIETDSVAVIDTSTAHRTADGWVYGFAELRGKREEIKNSHRIANPGCHASGFVSLVAPLTECGIIKPDAALTCFSLTGYSGGGKKMIAEYEADGRDPLLDAPRTYGLGQSHKHLPEMSVVCGLETLPVFCPIVAPFYSGMEVTVPLTARDTDADVGDIIAAYKAYYTDGVVRVRENPDESGFLSAAALSGRDDMELSVYGKAGRITLVSRFDNLGKGASGSAIQNMNIILGVPETEGLTV